jgi:mono/diheme cytochrome c family protein
MTFIRVSFLGLAAALIAGTAAVAAQAPQGNAQRGHDVFVRVGCYSCHGYQGQGAGTGPRIARTAHSWAAFSTFVRNTSGDMPPFTQRVLPDQDLADIYTYLESLPVPPDPKTIPLLQQVGG